MSGECFSKHGTRPPASWSGPPGRWPGPRAALGLTLGWLLIPLLQFPSVFLGSALFRDEDVLGLEFSIKQDFFGRLAAGIPTWFYGDNQLGISLAGNPVYGLFYPPSALYLLLPPVTAFKAIYVFHYPWAAWGFLAWMLVLGARWPFAASGVTLLLGSGLVWSFHNVATVDLQALSWVGWTAAAMALSVQRRSWLLALVAGVASSMAFLAGDPVSCMIALGMGLASPHLTVPTHPGWRLPPWRTWLALGGAAAASMLANCLPWLVQGQQLTAVTERGRPFAPVQSMSFSSHPMRMLDVALPWLLPPLGDPSFPSPHLRYGLGQASWWFQSVALGLLGTALAVLGVRRLARRSLGGISWLAGALVLAWLACGRNVSGAEWVWSHAPVLSSMRFPERLLKYVLMALLPAFCMGYRIAGLALARRFRVPVAWACAGLVALSLAEITATLPAVTAAPSEELLTAHPPFDALLALRADNPSQPPRLALCDFTRKEGEGSRADGRPWRVPMLAALDPSLALVSMFFTCPEFGHPIVAVWLGVSHVMAFPAEGNLVGALLSRGGNTLLDRPPDDTWSAIALRASNPWTGMFTPHVELRSPLPDVIDVDARGYPHLDLTPLFDAMDQGTLWANPRLQLNTLGRLATPSPDATRAVERAAQGTCSPRLVPLALDATGDRLSFSLDTPCAGLVSVPWRLLPGWRLELDGQPAPLWWVGDLTLGVFLEAGAHRAELWFEPYLWTELLAVSLGWSVVVAILGLLALARRARRGRAP